MASAWLTANPTTPNHGMTDSAFIISCMVRLMQDVISNDPQAPRICAACGQIVDKQGAHLRKCRELAAQGGRQKLRNTWHKALQHIMIKFTPHRCETHHKRWGTQSTGWNKPLLWIAPRSRIDTNQILCGRHIIPSRRRENHDINWLHSGRTIQNLNPIDMLATRTSSRRERKAEMV